MCHVALQIAERAIAAWTHTIRSSVLQLRDLTAICSGGSLRRLFGLALLGYPVMEISSVLLLAFDFSAKYVSF
jgi:hypothetical protein